jgi:hypothetical protein
MRTVALTAADPTAHSHPQMATTHSSVSLMPADGTESIVVLCAEDRFAAAVVRFWADEGQEAGSTPENSRGPRTHRRTPGRKAREAARRT